jgi:hypothetical protein
VAINPQRSARTSAPLARGRGTHQVERRVYIKAPPRVVWATLGDPANAGILFPELTLGPAEPAWPAAAAMRRGRARMGLLRTDTTVESLEARPSSSIHLRLTGRGFESEWRWRMQLLAGGTRVVHDAVFKPGDRISAWLIRLGRDSLSERVEAHLRALKELAEATFDAESEASRGSRLA